MNIEKGYTNMAMREGEMTTCILNEGELEYSKQTDSYSVTSPIIVDNIVELDTKKDNIYSNRYFIPFVRKYKPPSTFAMGVVMSEPLWERLPQESKSIRDWEEIRENRYYRLAVIYLLRPIAVVNNRYLLTSQILEDYADRKQKERAMI